MRVLPRQVASIYHCRFPNCPPVFLFLGRGTNKATKPTWKFFQIRTALVFWYESYELILIAFNVERFRCQTWIQCQVCSWRAKFSTSTFRRGGGVVVRVADNLQTTISAQPDYSFRQQHGVWPWCFFVVQNKRFSLTLCSGRGDRTPIRINVLRGLLFLDEAYEKMACIYCQGNPSLTLIRELLIVIGPTLQWLKQLFWNRFTQRREYQIRWEEAARAHLSWIRNVLLVAGRDHSL